MVAPWVLAFGGREIVRAFAAMRTTVERDMRANLFRTAENVMADAKRITPIDLNPLRSSGYVRKDGSDVIAGFNKDYAILVHEIPPPEEGAPSPRQWRPGKRTAKHRPPTQWKFLQDPAEKHFSNIAEQFSGKHNMLNRLRWPRL